MRTFTLIFTASIAKWTTVFGGMLVILWAVNLLP